MKNRFGLRRFRFPTIGSKARRRLGKSPDEGRLSVADIIIVAAAILLTIDFLPESLPYRREVQTIIVALLYFAGLFLSFRHLAPRPCWSRASWVTGLTALLCTTLPWLLYWSKDMPLNEARSYSLMSISVWVVFAICLLRLHYVRRRSKCEIALLRMRQNRKTKQRI